MADTAMLADVSLPTGMPEQCRKVADEWQLLADELEAYAEHMGAWWKGATRHTQGDAMVAAIKKAVTLATITSRYCSGARQIACILREAAHQWERVEEFAWQARVSSDSLYASTIPTTVQWLAQVIDAHTAQALAHSGTLMVRACFPNDKTVPALFETEVAQLEIPEKTAHQAELLPIGLMSPLGVLENIDSIHQRLVADPGLPEITALAEHFPDMRILAAGPHHVAAVFGDLDTSPQAVTYVGGVGTSQPQEWVNQLQRAQQLAAATRQPTIAWIGYTAPPTVASAMNNAYGQQGAKELAAFQRHLQVRAALRGNPQKLTILAHSYGSYVAGRAARDHGLVCDKLVVVGSPGMGVLRAKQLRLEATSDDTTRPHVQVFMGDRDPIDVLAFDAIGPLGADPATRRFGAEYQVIPGDHDSYFSDPNVLAALSADQGDDSGSVKAGVVRASGGDDSDQTGVSVQGRPIESLPVATLLTLVSKAVNTNA